MNALRARPMAWVLAAMVAAPCAWAAPRPHGVHLGAARSVPYSREGDPAGAKTGEHELKVRALIADGQVKDWTTGDEHEVTRRSFVVRRALRLNDSLPGDKSTVWVWQRGPWLLVDRASGHVSALKLPDYNPAVSRVVWFRDYGAYCGVTPSGKSLYAVVAQLAVRRPVLARKLGPFDAQTSPRPACGMPEWQRQPLRVTFHPADGNAVSFDIVAGSSVLVEGSGDGDSEAQQQSAQSN